ncbi:MAG: Sensory box histidine kinase/response regulator [Candidatus Angelobacter sp.]|jgi:PAS domain S-box-containing protein|nr:Sensory box histidine kinase/response regulator [Candidatus Angelobacter sp.]
MRPLTPIERWELSYQVTNVLAESSDSQAAITEILALVGRAMEFDAGSFWVVHELRSVLRCVSFWSGTDRQFPNFELVTRVRDLSHGQGLPGKAWEVRKPVCFPDVTKAPNFPRAMVAEIDGIRFGIAFPAFRLRRVFGVFEFFSRKSEAADEDTMKFFAALGVQIGVFLEHFRISDSVIEDEAEVRLAAERSVDAVLTIDEHSKVIYANSAVFKVFGWKPKELIGGSLTRIMPEYLRHVHEQGIQRYTSTGKRHLDWSEIHLPALHKDGHEIPVTLAFGEFWRAGSRVFTGFARLRRSSDQTHVKGEIDNLSG